MFPTNPQAMIAHLLGSGAMTCDGIRSVLMAGSVLYFPDTLLNPQVTWL